MVVSAVQRWQRSGVTLWQNIRRRKYMSDEPSQLARVLSLFDLTSLSLGSTLGLGAYVLAGQVAKEQAGPAVVISFAIGAVASLFAGLCYSEFGARVPKAGSAYVYTYVAIGEIVAFVIGWTLILEYAIGTASVTRGVTGYVDNLVDDAISDFFEKYLPMDVSFLADYPDFFAFGIIVVITGLLAFGVKESAIFNNVLTALNLTTLAVAIVAGGIKSNPENWFLSLSEIPEEYRSSAGTGGFMPFGFKGVVAGAATCFFGFTGFDSVATTSEEAKNPRRDIPLAIMGSLVLICVLYCAIAITLTMMWPYYAQNVNAPFAYAFEMLGLNVIRWIVTIGAIFALTTSLLAVLFPLPRIVYAMSQDGLLFEFFSRVNGFTKTPLLATVISGLLSAVMATLFELTQLTEMMSIGTLLAYTIVAYNVLVLRYTVVSTPNRIEKRKPWSLERIFNGLLNREKATRPTSDSAVLSSVLIGIYTLVSLGLSVFLQICDDIYDNPLPYLGTFISLIVILIILILMQYVQPQAYVENLSFRVPWLPFIPMVSITMNLYLMVELQAATWIRFIIWMAIGFMLYFSYSVRYSKEIYRKDSEMRQQRERGQESIPSPPPERGDALTTL